MLEQSHTFSNHLFQIIWSQNSRRAVSRMCVILQLVCLAVTLKSTFGYKVSSGSMCYICQQQDMRYI